MCRLSPVPETGGHICRGDGWEVVTGYVAQKLEVWDVCDGWMDGW